MKNRALNFLFALFFPLCAVFPNINFQGLDLSGDNRLLFSAVSTESGQHAVFISRLTDLALQQITAFPEKIDLVENGRSLLVRNVFGVSLVPLAGGLPRPLSGFPSFVTGNIPVSSRAESLAVSYDGRWLLQMEPENSAYGNLVLTELSTGQRRIISTQVERHNRNFPANWSPDSRVFVYCKNGKLYYYPLLIESAIEEQYRFICEGGITSISWGRRGDFFYVRENVLYRVGGNEIFTRAVYADFLEIGQVIGLLPLEFDPDFDLFWIAPDSRSLLFSKGGRNVFYYPLDAGLNSEETPDFALPYIKLPAGAFDIKVLWPISELPTITATVQKKDSLEAIAFRLSPDGKESMNFIPMRTPLGSHYALSPDGNRVLVWGERGAVQLNYNTWMPIMGVQAGPVNSCLWINNNEYIIADNWRIEGVDVSGNRRLICLAGALEYAFEEGSLAGRILAMSGGAWYVTDGVSPWAPIENPRPGKASQISGRYRVYLEKQSGFPYENLPMIRNTTSTGTSPLLPMPSFVDEPSAADTGLNNPAGVFVHGQRAGQREVAVCFDLYDDDTGLSHALEALSNFGIRATFFLNGNFIRRHPEAVRCIAESGHEAASMFYAPVDLSSSRYRFNDEYIAKGLARNEDEYFQATGRELSLLWHPPFYRISGEIATAARRAGYLTVGSDVDPLDWMSREEALRLGINRDSVPEMIQKIMEKKERGSIIPIRLGRQTGRNDYLFLNIEVLLEALVRSGYSVVPVSTLAGRGL